MFSLLEFCETQFIRKIVSKVKVDTKTYFKFSLTDTDIEI